MQSKQEIRDLIKKNELALKEKYTSIYDINYSFESTIKDVIHTEGLFYSESYWLDNLNLITENDIFIPLYAILESKQWQNEFEEQPYFLYVEGMLDILSVYKFNASGRDTLNFAKYIFQQGKIDCIFPTHGFRTGKRCFFFSNFCYSWI